MYGVPVWALTRLLSIITLSSRVDELPKCGRSEGSASIALVEKHLE